MDLIINFVSGKQGTTVTSETLISEGLDVILDYCYTPKQSETCLSEGLQCNLQYHEMLLLCCIVLPPRPNGGYWKWFITAAFAAKEALFRKKKSMTIFNTNC